MVETKGGNNLNIREVYLSLISLSVYRGLLLDNVISKFHDLLEYTSGTEACLEGFIGYYCGFYNEYTGNNTNGTLKEYIAGEIIYDENPFTKACENNDFCSLAKELVSAASRDLAVLQKVSVVSSFDLKAYAKEKFCKKEYEKELVESLPVWDTGTEPSGAAEDIESVLLTGDKWDERVEELAKFHNRNGTGIFIRYRAFVWDKSGDNGFLRGVDNSDPVTLADLIGYEAEREEVITNTLQFLKGYYANNVLLYGDRGTGKSSTVKAILNEYSGRGLRVIEVPKTHLADFSRIINALKGRRQKFIIFVDDLVFEDSEENYTTLKAILEGGLENRPKNVLIYATSNRRHLIKEKFSDRMGLQSGKDDDEIRAADTIQEKLSLADRFGITVVYSSPDKNRYLEIVEGIAAKRGISVDREQLHKEALKWELWYNGRSPRTARQFVDWLEGQLET